MSKLLSWDLVCNSFTQAKKKVPGKITIRNKTELLLPSFAGRADALSGTWVKTTVDTIQNPHSAAPHETALNRTTQFLRGMLA